MVFQTDASCLYRIGYTFLQEQGQGRMHLAHCDSRFLTDAETRYATVELEMLAFTWAISKCRLYLSSLPHFTLMTNHHPLIPINSYTLDTVKNPHLQWFKERISHPHTHGQVAGREEAAHSRCALKSPSQLPHARTLPSVVRLLHTSGASSPAMSVTLRTSH